MRRYRTPFVRNGVDGVVVGAQDECLSRQYARRGGRGVGARLLPHWAMRASPLSHLHGEPDGKGGTLSQGTCDGDIAPHHLAEASADGESQPGTTILPGRRGVDLDKILK